MPNVKTTIDPADGWVELTGAASSKATLYLLSGARVFVQQASAAPPASENFGDRFRADDASDYPDLLDFGGRLYARAYERPSEIYISSVDAA